jgi:hypothetical protein
LKSERQKRIVCYFLIAIRKVKFKSIKRNKGKDGFKGDDKGRDK